MPENKELGERRRGLRRHLHQVRARSAEVRRLLQQSLEHTELNSEVENLHLDVGVILDNFNDLVNRARQHQANAQKPEWVRSFAHDLIHTIALYRELEQKLQKYPDLLRELTDMFTEKAGELAGYATYLLVIPEVLPSALMHSPEAPKSSLEAAIMSITSLLKTIAHKRDALRPLLEKALRGEEMEKKAAIGFLNGNAILEVGALVNRAAEHIHTAQRIPHLPEMALIQLESYQQTVQEYLNELDGYFWLLQHYHQENSIPGGKIPENVVLNDSVLRSILYGLHAEVERGETTTSQQRSYWLHRAKIIQAIIKNRGKVSITPRLLIQSRQDIRSVVKHSQS